MINIDFRAELSNSVNRSFFQANTFTPRPTVRSQVTHHEISHREDGNHLVLRGCQLPEPNVWILSLKLESPMHIVQCIASRLDEGRAAEFVVSCPLFVTQSSSDIFSLSPFSQLRAALHRSC